MAIGDFDEYYADWPAKYCLTCGSLYFCGYCPECELENTEPRPVTLGFTYRDHYFHPEKYPYKRIMEMVAEKKKELGITDG